MAHDHLYQPASCSHWPEDLLQAVGGTYREAWGEGLEQLACLDHAKAAYIAAGERGDWLWGSAEEWLEHFVAGEHKERAVRGVPASNKAKLTHRQENK